MHLLDAAPVFFLFFLLLGWTEAAAMIGGQMLGNKGQKQAAQQSSDAQRQLAQQMFQEQLQYINSQNQGLRTAAGQMASANPFFGAGLAAPPPAYLAAGSNAATFGPSTGTNPSGGSGATSPQGLGNKSQSLPNKGQSPAPAPGPSLRPQYAGGGGGPSRGGGIPLQ